MYLYFDKKERRLAKVSEDKIQVSDKFDMIEKDLTPEEWKQIDNGLETFVLANGELSVVERPLSDIEEKEKKAKRIKELREQLEKGGNQKEILLEILNNL